jgi:hypothetical protein
MQLTSVDFDTNGLKLSLTFVMRRLFAALALTTSAHYNG